MEEKEELAVAVINSTVCFDEVENVYKRTCKLAVCFAGVYMTPKGSTHLAASNRL